MRSPRDRRLPHHVLLSRSAPGAPDGNPQFFCRPRRLRHVTERLTS